MITADINLEVLNFRFDEDFKVPGEFSISESKEGTFFSLDDIEIDDWSHFSEKLITLVDPVLEFAKPSLKLEGTLDIAVFYDLSETIIFPFKLSREFISLLGGNNISVDVTGYPCSEDIPPD